MKTIGDIIRTPDGTALPLSAGIEGNGIVFLSGQIPLRDGATAGADIEEQTELVVDSIERLLGEAGLTLDRVVRSSVWLTRAEDFAGFNRVYARRFKAPYPARSTVVSALAVPGALIEIEVTAIRPDGAR